MSNLYLSKDIYNVNCINHTVNAFSDYAEIEISQNSTHFICSFKNTVYDSVETAKEFENYLIDYCNKSGF